MVTVAQLGAAKTVTVEKSGSTAATVTVTQLGVAVEASQCLPVLPSGSVSLRGTASHLVGVAPGRSAGIAASVPALSLSVTANIPIASLPTLVFSKPLWRTFARVLGAAVSAAASLSVPTRDYLRFLYL